MINITSFSSSNPALNKRISIYEKAKEDVQKQMKAERSLNLKKSMCDDIYWIESQIEKLMIEGV